jgi:hypothetical protein
MAIMEIITGRHQSLKERRKITVMEMGTETEMEAGMATEMEMEVGMVMAPEMAMGMVMGTGRRTISGQKMIPGWQNQNGPVKAVSCSRCRELLLHYSEMTLM